MNVLIIQQLAWGIRIGHEIGRSLHGRGHTLAALVHGLETRDFVERQREVPYRHVYFADPLYDAGGDRVAEATIREIEERYGIDSVWRVIVADRILVYSFLNSRQFVSRRPKSNDYVLSVLARMAAKVREIVDTVRPDYVVAPNVASLMNYLLYLECRCRKIPFYSVAYSGFGKYLFIADDEVRAADHIRARCEELLDEPGRSARHEEARDLYVKFVAGHADARAPYSAGARAPRSAAAVAGRFLASTALLPARLVRAGLRSRRALDIRNIWLPNNSRLNALRNVWINYREGLVTTDRQGECIRDLGRVGFPYVFYPLHVEPELPLMVWAPKFANQLETCRRIAMELPAGIRLLVKEHPGMVSSRRSEFYEELRGLPNVELVHSSLSASAILQSPLCQGVVVVASSVGIEAALNGRPVVVLGPSGYDVFPWVHRVTTLEDATARIRRMCLTPERPGPEEVERRSVAYLAAVVEHCVQSDYHRAWNQSAGDAGPEAIVDAIEERFRADR